MFIYKFFPYFSLFFVLEANGQIKNDTIINRKNLNKVENCINQKDIYEGEGLLNFLDIFPNTQIKAVEIFGNISFIKQVKTSLGVLKIAEVFFDHPMKDTSYQISLFIDTRDYLNNQILNIEYPIEKSVKCYITNKTVASFYIVAEELYPAKQMSKIKFSFKVNNPSHEENNFNFSYSSITNYIYRSIFVGTYLYCNYIKPKNKATKWTI